MMNDSTTNLPDEVAAIGRCGYVVFTDESLPAEFRERFDAGRIPVTAIRHVRQWGLQVDDEFECQDMNEPGFLTRSCGRLALAHVTAPLTR